MAIQESQSPLRFLDCFASLAMTMLDPTKSNHALKLHHLPGAHAFVGGEDDAQRVDRVLKMLAEVDLAADRLEEQALLALA